jgi:hypothetical protein
VGGLMLPHARGDAADRSIARTRPPIVAAQTTSRTRGCLPADHA